MSSPKFIQLLRIDDYENINSTFCFKHLLRVIINRIVQKFVSFYKEMSLNQENKMEEYDLFLSYNHKHKDAVNKLYKFLTDNDIKC